MFFLQRLNSFNVDCYILQLFYKAVLQSILSFGLISVFGNTCNQDQDKRGQDGGYTGCDQMSAAQLWKDF